MNFSERQRLDYILEGTNVGTWQWNVQTGEAVFDQRWAEIVGYSLDELSPVSIETWISLAHPDDLQKSNEALQKCFSGELDYYHFEARMKHRDGHWVWVLDRGKVATWTKDGKPEWMFGTHQEISERKHFEEDLKRERNLFVSGPVVVFKWKANDAWPMEYVTPNVEQLLGYTVDELKKGEVTYDSIVHPDDLNRVVSEVKIHSAAGRASFDQEYRLIKADQSVIHIYDYTVVVRNSQGEITHYDGYILDTTDRIRAEREIQRMQKLDSLGMVAGGIAHDFNNLMTGVFGNIQLAKLEAVTGSPANNYLQNALDVMQNAKDLIGQLLTFAKGGTPVIETVESRELVRETVLFNLQGSNILADFDLQDDLWDLQADKSQIARVFSNLTLNARQTMVGGGTLQIKGRNYTENTGQESGTQTRDFICLEFRDEGAGIPDHDIERIFDPYYSTRDSGHGLGLSVVHSIISQHSGQVKVDSKVGVGTTFTVLLPVMSREEIRADHVDLAFPEDSEDVQLRILLMDDDESIRDLGTHMLSYLGHSVEVTADGTDACEKYGKAIQSGNPFDIVMMDLTIPGGTGGVEAIDELQRIDPNVCAIVSSGYSTDPVLANYEDYGFRGKLAKPFGLDDLRQTIERVME